jgi:DNA-binding beta-propeller fold protein YncE
LKNPAGIICDAGGNVMVVDSGNDRLQVFTPDGKALTQCGRNGSGEGEFNKPWGITLDNEGNIYVADWKNHRVQKLSPNGEFIMSIGKYGTLPVPENAFGVSYLGPFLSHTDPPGYPKAGILNHPTGAPISHRSMAAAASAD